MNLFFKIWQFFPPKNKKAQPVVLHLCKKIKNKKVTMLTMTTVQNMVFMQQYNLAHVTHVPTKLTL